jgi:hypothetical protein
VVAAPPPRRNRRGSKHAPDCEHPVHLWDALAFATHEISSLPGRRVILAVTEGNDRGSRYSWNVVRTYAQGEGVTIFGLSYAPDEPEPFRFQKLGYENPFTSVCELSGGMVLSANGKTVERELLRFVRLVRGRYIVEFPRPARSTGGPHRLIVSIDKSNAFIRPAGLAVPLADPALLADPMTIPSDPSRTPELGTHRIPTTPQ